jgi:phage terminase small subunit
MASKLTQKQKRFCDEYLIDLNATQAAIRADYSKKRASELGYQLLQKTPVQEYISNLVEKRSKITQIDAAYVLNRLVEIDQMDALDILNDDGSCKSIKDWPKIWRQFICGMDVSEIFIGSGEERELAGILKKIKWPDKIKNLELIGKHVDVQAFKDKVEHTGKVEFNVVSDSLKEMIEDK